MTGKNDVYIEQPDLSGSAVLLDRDHIIRVGLATGKKSIEIVTPSESTVRAGESVLQIEPNSLLTFEPVDSVPAEIVYHVIVETVLGGPETDISPALDRWTARGYDPVALYKGTILRSETGIKLDGRSILISAARYDSEQQARDTAEIIRQKGWNCWVAGEPVTQSSGTIQLIVQQNGDKGSIATYNIKSPLYLSSSGRITVRNVNFGFWSSKVQDCEFIGTLRTSIDPAGKLELVEELTLEEYLRGVVPAEMPSSWPVAALEAQAVCARSETLSRLGVRHMGDDFDLCATEHCQAYRGASWHTESTDIAVANTAGVVLMNQSRLVEAVYSHNCGGHTENNEVVWASPPDETLRGVPDTEPGALAGKSLQNESDLRDWLASGDAAYCSHLKPDEMKNYRWRVTRTAPELDQLVAKKYPQVGRVLNIRSVARGVSGRLQTIEIIGDRHSVLVHKELPIRKLFGGLYSAMCVINIERDTSGRPTSFEFIGGGRGHGVGMCQDGARYMASIGRDYETILHHYYEKASIVHLYQ